MTTEHIGKLAAGATVALLVAGGGVWAVPEGQEDQRRRQLQVFEGLLTDLVQERVTLRVNSTIDLERGGDGVIEVDGDVGIVALEPVVVKVGRPLAAHGFYLDGYGVMFSIQTPQVAVLPRSFDARMEAPITMLRTGPNLWSEGHRVAPGLIDIRADMLMRSIGDLRVLIERDAAEDNDAALHELAKFEDTLEQIRHAVAPRADAPHADDQEEAAVLNREFEETERARRAYEVAAVRPRQRDARAYFRGAIEQQRSLKQILERDHQQIADAVNDAAIEALAQFGTVLRGLDSDDQVSIMVLPPNEWNLARRHGVGVDQGEYVISIRYKDIRDFGNEKIDMDKFRERVEIHNRLGIQLEIKIVTDEQ